HTGAWCEAVAAGDNARAARELDRLRSAALHAASLGIECHAGHGLDYDTARIAAAIPEIMELNIGHFMVGEAVLAGLQAVVEAMRAAIDEGRRSISVSARGAAS